MKVLCQECNKMVEAKIVKGDVIYPHRTDLYHLDFFQCPICGNYKEIQQGEKNSKLLIVLPTPEVRQARMRVHNIIDPLWKSKKIKRDEIYKRLSKELHCDYHNNNCIDLERLEKAYRIALEIQSELEGV